MSHTVKNSLTGARFDQHREITIHTYANNHIELEKALKEAVEKVLAGFEAGSDVTGKYGYDYAVYGTDEPEEEIPNHL
jgi:hypothetical protein